MWATYEGNVSLSRILDARRQTALNSFGASSGREDPHCDITCVLSAIVCRWTSTRISWVGARAKVKRQVPRSCLPAAGRSAKRALWTVPLQCSLVGHTNDSFLGFWAGSPPFGTCKTVLEAATVANNAHFPCTSGCYMRAVARLCADSTDKLAQLWEGWCNKFVEAGNPLVWYDVEKNIEVTRVEHPVLP